MTRILVLAAACLSVVVTARGADPAPPNIIFIYADDLGYGDVGCYGATRIKTPNIDRLAAEGLRFTDAHSPAATCTPSRYALLTGEYAFRKPGTGILPGDASLIIQPGRTTLPSMLKQAGYATGVVGKWHLGLGDPAAPVDWNGSIKPGPMDIGFDHNFLIPATGDRVPTVYVDDRRVTGLDPADPIRVDYAKKVGSEPTGRENPELLRMKFSHGHDYTIINGVSRIGWMAGGKSARWVDEEMSDLLTRKSIAFIEENKARPFFLYLPTHSIHVPRLPHPRFIGKSGCGLRGDSAEELDWCVGEILAALEKNGLTENTMVIFSSDNGPVVDDGYADGAVADLNGHTPSGPLRGGKYSFYEGGTRVPFIVRWPAKVKPGVSNALICQIDFLASFAALAGKTLDADAGPDSINVLPALLGTSPKGRDELVEQGPGLSLRQGTWKLVRAGGATNNASAKKKAAPAKKKNASQATELYNLADDLGETRNLASERPELVAEMARRLDQIRTQGRSRPTP